MTTNNGWKITAIIFIILFIISSSVIGWMIYVGTIYNHNKNTCMANICGDIIYDSFYYDGNENICYCYNGGVVELTKYLG
jgi:hypothetical protein